MAINKLGSVICITIAVLLLAFLLPGFSAAHPMGNFSINHFSAIALHPNTVRVTYIIDMAEIPTFQEMQDSRLVAEPDDPSAVQYRDRKVEEWRQGLILRIGEQDVPMSPRSSELTFPAGAGGLPTLRLTVVYEAAARVESGTLVYEDRNYPQRIGWKEIIASGYDGVNITRSSVPIESKSQQLTSYATDLLQAPPQDVRVELTFAISSAARAQGSATDTVAEP